MKPSSISILIKILIALMIISSIFITYYVMVVKKDYEIFTNPDGPDTSDYFE